MVLFKNNSFFHWTQQRRAQLYSTSSEPVTSCSKQHLLQSRTWAMESPCPYKFSFWWRSSCAASGIIASSLESGSFSCVPNRALLFKYRIILLSSIYASCWNGENVWRGFEDLLISYLYRQKLSSQDGYQMRKIH